MCLQQADIKASRHKVKRFPMTRHIETWWKTTFYGNKFKLQPGLPDWAGYSMFLGSPRAVGFWA